MEVVDPSTYDRKEIKMKQEEKFKKKMENKEMDYEVKKKTMNPLKQWAEFKDTRAKKAKNEADLIKHNTDMMINLEEQKKAQDILIKNRIEEAKNTIEGKRINKLCNYGIAKGCFYNNPDKQALMQNNVEQNPIIQEFIDENVVCNSMYFLDKRIRTCLQIGIEYLNTQEQYEHLVRRKLLQEDLRRKEQQEQAINVPVTNAPVTNADVTHAPVTDEEKITSEKEESEEEKLEVL